MPSPSPRQALIALKARLAATGIPLVECVSPNGLLDGGSIRLNRGYSVKPKKLKWDKNRRASRLAGGRVSLVFAVSIGYVLRPADGIDAVDEPLTDIDNIMATLYEPDTPLTGGTAYALYISDAVFEYHDGGAYLIVRFDVSPTFNMPLVP